MEEQLARSRPEEYPSLHPVHCPVFADQPVCGGRRMEMGPSGFLLKSLVTTHLDIRSYSSHAPSQGIKTNANTNAKSNTKAKTKISAKDATTKTSAKNAKTLQHYTGFSWVVSCLLTNSKIVAKSLQFNK